MDKALLVGINKYPDAPLDGCVNDITDMAQLLTSTYGFTSSSIRLLVDGRATTSAIKERLSWLVSGAKRGDRLVFHYSGHGTQFPSRNDAAEVDGMDEAICPVDFDWSEAHTIRDNYFRDLFSKVPAGVKLSWISDSCHSGTLTRETVRVKNRVYPMPADMLWRARVAEETEIEVGKMRTAHFNGIYISGCQDEQTSADARFSGRANGALTYFLVRAAAKNPSVPAVELVDTIRASLRKSRFSQIPQISLPTSGSQSVLFR
jgi:hypothetical protein